MAVNDILPIWHIKSSPYNDKIIKITKNNNIINIITLNNCEYLLIGRKKELCNIYLEHQSISRKHAIIFFGDVNNSTYIIDLNSSHGTFINGKKIDSNISILLNLEDVIQFGQSTRNYIYTKKELKPLVPQFNEGNQVSQISKVSEVSEVNNNEVIVNDGNNLLNENNNNEQIINPTHTDNNNNDNNSNKRNLSKEEQRKEREKEIAAFALEMSSTVPIFNSTKTILTKEEALLAAKV